MSLGAVEAAHAVGMAAQPIVALDFDPVALGVYQANFPDAAVSTEPIELVLDGELGDPPTANESDLLSRVGSIDLLLGGPPCQGHSDLNNHTRRSDPKNQLYLKMARFAELFEPSWLVIENVQGVRHDRGGVVERTASALEDIGYHVLQGLLSASDYGVPQRRRRFFMVASQTPLPDSIEALLAPSKVHPRTFSWACDDLQNVESDGVFDRSGQPSGDSERRMKYMFDRDLFDLPDSQRPDCHRLKTHSYRSVYGRLHADQPAPTITSGFGSMGQGRYVHPTEQRTITPHEAARLQTFPDWFKWGDQKRGAYQRMIGNAVPPLLAQAVVIELLAR